LLHAVYSSLADARCDIKQLLTLSGADHPWPMSQGATQRCRGHAPDPGGPTTGSRFAADEEPASRR